MPCFSRNRKFHSKIILLSNQELLLEITDVTNGQEILDSVYRHLNLIETSYFGLRYLDKSNQTHWLDASKSVSRQIKTSDPVIILYFGVKFYAADPCVLVEEITRYQFFLQVKQDILQGRLPVPFDLAAELGSYVVQSELGDYDVRRHTPGYVSEFRFVSNQTSDLEKKIEDLHKNLIGKLPSYAELNYLEKVKWLEMYGVDLHPVMGEDNTEYFLGLTPTGVIVLRNKSKVANYTWPRITKIYHKGKYFMLRVNDKNNEENTFGFEIPSKAACKHLYKCCVEHNAFFCSVQITPNPPDIIGSSGPKDDGSVKICYNYGINSNKRFPSKPSNEIIEVNKDVSDKLSLSNNIQSSVLFNKTFNSVKLCESPRSVRSAPPKRGLFTTSPRSTRSSSRIRYSRRSVSVESHSSTDSKLGSRYNSRRRGSDNDSEISKSSNKSRRRRNRNRRFSRTDDRRHSNSSKLAASTQEFPDLTKLPNDSNEPINNSFHKNKTQSDYSRRIRYVEDYNKDETKSRSQRSHKHHRQRNHSKSNGLKSHLPDEIKKQIEFHLIETEGMSDSQLKEIPYKTVDLHSHSKHSLSSNQRKIDSNQRVRR